MRQLTVRLEAVLADRYPEFVRQLRPPAIRSDAIAAWQGIGVNDLSATYLDLMSWHDGTQRKIDLIPEVGGFLDTAYAQKLFSQLVVPDADWLDDEVEGLSRGVPVFAFQNTLVLVHPDDESLWQVDVIDGPVQIFDTIRTCVQTVIEWYESGSIVVDEEIFPDVARVSEFRAVHRRLNPESFLPVSMQS